jgi:hypothetical protein
VEHEYSKKQETVVVELELHLSLGSPIPLEDLLQTPSQESVVVHNGQITAPVSISPVRSTYDSMNSAQTMVRNASTETRFSQVLSKYPVIAEHISN